MNLRLLVGESDVHEGSEALDETSVLTGADEVGLTALVIGVPVDDIEVKVIDGDGRGPMAGMR
jgi:hypothetical protein